jgi:triacylglycerol lipase
MPARECTEILCQNPATSGKMRKLTPVEPRRNVLIFKRRTTMAANPVPAPAVPANVAAARLQVQTTDFYALCYLLLCNLAYANEDNAQKAIQQITDLLPTMPVPQPPAPVQGRWTLNWGPEATGDNSNLMYGAEFLDSVSGLPVFAAVVIRGTDTQANPSGVIKQLMEDLDAATQVPFPDRNTVGSKIAHGTQVGLGVLTGFKDGSGRTVDQYVKDFVTKNPDTPVVVTGHSLGGCQTTVMALFLSDQLTAAGLAPKIVPNSFAAPTAGNAAFIQLYEQTFPFAPRWFNTFDLVPMAFAGLGGIKQLWTQCGRPAPDAFKVIIDLFGLLLGALHISYSQQSLDDNRGLAGVCQPAGAPTASAAVQAQIVADIQAIFQDAVKKLQDQLGKIPLLGAVAAHLPGINLTAASFQNIGDWVKELLFQHLVLTGYWNAVADANGVARISNPFEQAAGAGGNH